MSSEASRASGPLAELIESIESSPVQTGDLAARALEIVRNGVITGEGPTTKGRVHFSRSLDSGDAKWCSRILLAANEHPVSREEAEALFRIDEAASERSDDGLFDDLFSKAILHHAAAASGLPVPPRAVALSPDTDIESWAPTRSVGVSIEVLEWISGQMRGRRKSNRRLAAMVAALVGAATLPMVQSLPNWSSMIDLGM